MHEITNNKGWNIMSSIYTKRLRIMDDVIAYTEEEIQDIYKEVLGGSRLKFPSGFWTTDEKADLYHAKVVTRYLIEDILKWDKEEVIKSFNSDLLRQYKLSGMISRVFAGSTMPVLENAYPGKYDPKEMQATCMRQGNDMVQKETLRLRKLCEGLSHGEIVKLYDNAFCLKNRFQVIHLPKFNINKFQLLDTAFPGEFCEWEFNVASGFWAIEENRRRATLWLMKKEGTKAITTRQCIDNGMCLVPTYGKGIDNVICEALGIEQEEFREDFRELLCQCHSNGMDLSGELGVNVDVVYSWMNRNARPTFSFIVENYDKLVEISERPENSPEGLYQKILDGKVSKFPVKYWQKENSHESAARITRYAVERILHWDPIEVMLKLRFPVFKKLKLEGLYEILFQCDREQAIANAYPEISWENRKFQLYCTRWLIDKTGKLVPSVKDFNRYKLRPIMRLADKDDLVREVYGIQNIDCLREMERFRMQQDLSIEEFAGMAGISQATVYYGKDDSARQLSLETEIKIMQAIRNQEGKSFN